MDGYPEFDIPVDAQKTMLSSPLILNQFVNSQGTLALMVISLESITKSDSKRESIINNISRIASDVLGGKGFHLGGLDIITHGLNQLSRHDFPVFTGVGFMLMFIIILLLYRSIACVVLALATTFSSIWLSFAVHGLLGYRLNIFTIMVPPIIITIGIIALMHIINNYENLIKDHHVGRETARQALKRIFYPSLFATLTTIVGFISQVTSESAALREFGLLTSIAVFFIFFISFLFGSLLLPLYKASSHKNSDRFGGHLENLTKHLIKNRIYYWIAIFVTICLSIFGIYKIKIDMYPMGYFPRDHQVQRDHEFMTQQWGDYLPVDFTLTATDSNGLKNPELINAMIDFNSELSNLESVRKTFSFISVLDRFAWVAYKKSVNEIIANPILAPQFFKQFNALIGPDQGSLINRTKTQARLIITGPLLSVRGLEENIERIDSLGKKHFANLATLHVRGYPALYVKIMNYAFSSMFSSLLFAFILIFLIMLFMLKSLNLALVALAPNLFPLLVLLGSLGFLNINLDLATCTVTAIVLGISIDDTIFFLHHFQQEKLSGKTTLQAILQTQRHVGKVIILSGVVLFAGFAILMLASLNTVFYFGILTCIAVVAALLGEIILVPLILSKGST